MEISKIQKIKTYITSRWKELSVAVMFAGAVSLLGYTLLLQGIVMGIKISPLNNAFTKDAYYSPLTGVEVAQALAERPVTGIMIENSTDARPQSSLSQAGIVFEAVAEGGITRYLALYQETRPGVIGPVRSLRPYYLDWAMGFDASIIHAGGSGDALDKINSRGAKSINCLVQSAGCYRTSDRVAPHNLYSSFDKIDATATDLGYTKSQFTSYRYNRKPRPAATPTNTALTFDFSGPGYTTQWRYDRTSNRYLRWLAGAPDKDRESGKQIAVTNVVLIKMPTTYDGKYAVMNSIGKGEAVVFRDGVAINGKWSKQGPGDPLKLVDGEGNDISLNAGQSWFVILPTGRPATY